MIKLTLLILFVLISGCEVNDINVDVKSPDGSSVTKCKGMTEEECQKEIEKTFKISQC